MTRSKTLLVPIAVAALALAAVPDYAFARRGRGGDADRSKQRVDLSIAPGSALSPREARIDLERRGLDRQMLRVRLEGAARGFTLDVFMTGAGGNAVDVGDATEHRPGVYQWRVRTEKGQALPFGAADLAELSGRAVEVRTRSGETVATGTLPSIAAATAPVGRKADARTTLSLDGAAADTVADPATGHELRADVQVRHRDDGRDEFRVKVQGLAAGLVLDASLAAADGTETFIGTLRPDGETAGEYELRFRTDRGESLPLGVGSVAELAGMGVSIRTGAGDLVASGTVPAVGSVAARGGGADDGASHDADDDHGDDGVEDEAGDDHGDDGAGHDAGDDHGDDGVEDEAGDDHGDDGDDGAGHDAGDDHGDDGAEDEAGDDTGSGQGADDGQTR